MTHDQKKFYLEHEGALCPFCESSDLEPHGIKTDCDGWQQTVDCNECHKQWTDEFSLVNVRESE